MKYLRKKAMILCVCCFAFSAQAQHEKEPSIVVADSIWSKEIIPFPIEWAPKFSFEGFEELRFAPNWDTPDHDEFWSLVMSWEVIASEIISNETLEVSLESYFDGLMKPNHWSTDFMNPKALFITSYLFEGKPIQRAKLAVFDGFHTGKPILLNILSEQIRCSNSEKSIVIFRFSPQDYTHPIWERLTSIVAKKTICVE